MALDVTRLLYCRSNLEIVAVAEAVNDLLFNRLTESRRRLSPPNDDAFSLQLSEIAPFILRSSRKNTSPQLGIDVGHQPLAN